VPSSLGRYAAGEPWFVLNAADFDVLDNSETHQDFLYAKGSWFSRMLARRPKMLVAIAWDSRMVR
jgi:hypothetical protein